MQDAKTVFISGSRSIAYLPSQVHDAIDAMMSKNMYIFVGDASGADLLVQQYLVIQNYIERVYVFHVNKTPRHCLGNFNVCWVNTEKFPNIRFTKRHEYKDYYMTEHADYFLVIWDKESKGSLQNIKRGLKFGKTGKVFSCPDNKFLSKAQVNEFAGYPL